MFGKLLKIFREPTIPTVEEWAMKNAQITTVDQMLAAAIIQSFASDFDNWRDYGGYIVDEGRYDYFGRTPERNYTFKNDKKGLKVEIEMNQRTVHNDYNRKFKDIGLKSHYHMTFRCARVNDMAVDDKIGRMILKAYVDVKENIVKVRETTQRATHAMKVNEAKWDLFEKISGYRRTEAGALEPVVKV